MAPYRNLELHFFNWFSYSLILLLSGVLRISQHTNCFPRQVLACISFPMLHFDPSLSVTTFSPEFRFITLFKTTLNKPDIIGRCLSRLKLQYFLNYIMGMSVGKITALGPIQGDMIVHLIWHFPSFHHRYRARTFLSLSREIWMFPKADLVITVIQ